MSWVSVVARETMTRPSGRGKKGEVVSRPCIDDVLLITKATPNCINGSLSKQASSCPSNQAHFFWWRASIMIAFTQEDAIAIACQMGSRKSESNGKTGRDRGHVI